MTTANDRIKDVANAIPIAQSPDWRTAVADLANFWISQNRCFSSGEVAACLRTHRPDFAFAHTNLGERVRDLFYGGELAQYADDGYGNPTFPTMGSRYTEGLYPTRTPAGVTVFVYGPNAAACDAHEFEVFIPDLRRGETMDSAPPTATPVLQPARKAVALIGGTKTPAGDIEAKVWPDGRLCISRAAFEACVHLSGTPLKGGDPVFVTLEPDKVTVTLNDQPGAKKYDLSTTGGRIAVTRIGNPFVPGTCYKITVEAGKITVTL